MKLVKLGIFVSILVTALAITAGAQSSNQNIPTEYGAVDNLESTQVVPVVTTSIPSVTVDVTGGNMTITGDDNPNSIEVLGTAPGEWKIVGKGTLVNGAKKYIATGVTGSVTISLNGGDDTLLMHDGDVPGHLTILMGNDNDSTTMFNLTLGTFLHFEGNAGDDTLSISNLTVSDPTFAFFSTIDMQDGDDLAQITKFVDQDLQITLGNGKDELDLSHSTFVGGPFQRLRVDAGNDNDRVEFANVTTAPLNVMMGSGQNDRLVMKHCIADTEFLDGDAGAQDGTSDKIVIRNCTFTNTPTIVDFEQF